MRRSDTPEEFMKRVSPEPNSGCWLWLGTCQKGGYGKTGGRKAEDGGKLAHRLAYRLFRGPIAPGLVIDHLCRVRCCVNPYHLEPVTTKENNRRAGPFSVNARKTHCRLGHAYDEANTWTSKEGIRHCRACDRENQRRYRAARRVA